MSKIKAIVKRSRLRRRLNRATQTVTRTTANRKYHEFHSKFIGKAEETQEGFLVVPVVIAQKMVLDYPEYDTRELMGDDIFSPEYLASCDGCPFVLQHPTDSAGNPTDVLPENYEQYIKGVLIDPQVDKENDRVVGKLKVWDPEVIQSIKNGELSEVSQGYACKLIDNAGSFDGKPYDGVQAGLVMNHLALVDAGRAGEAVKVLYNGRKLADIQKEFERIERRRENMKNPNPARRNLDEQTIAGKPNPQNAELETPDQQATEDDRMAAIEKKLDILAAAVQKLMGGETNAEPDGDEDKKNEGGETPAPDDKKNEAEKEKDVMNRVTNALTAKIPQLIQQTIGNQTEAFMQAQVLLGEDAQDFAHRLNHLPTFRKEVLVRNGMPKAVVDRMTDAEAKVWLSVKADQAKEIELQPRANHSSYTPDGDYKANALRDF